MKILVPTSVPIHLEAPDGVTVVPYDVREPIPAQHGDAEAIATWGNPPARLAALPGELPRLRWVQALSAGIDGLTAAGFSPAVTIAAGTGLHDETVAEHALALMLAAARRLDRCVRAQDEHVWLRGVAGAQNPEGEPRTDFSMIRGSRVLIWGFGNIGRMLAGYLSAMGAEVTGVARSAGIRDGYAVVDEDGARALLPETDVLVNILPAGPATNGIVGADVFGALPQRAWYVNVGRGATTDSAALLDALTAGAIAGAALDVFETEPLPADSPLWDAPNLIITPHSAGNRPQRPGARIAENLRRDRAGEPLIGA